MSKIIKNEQGEEFIEVNGNLLKLKRVKQMPPCNHEELVENGHRLFFERISIEIEKMKSNDGN